jgi:hypothetical protein
MKGRNGLAEVRRDNMDKLEKSSPCLDIVPLEQIFIFANLLTYFNIGHNIIPIGSVYVKNKQITLLNLLF